VGMIGVEEYNAIVRRLCVLIMTSNRAAQPRSNIRGYYRGEGYCLLKDSKRKNSRPKLCSAINVDSLALHLYGRTKIALKCR